ncbi:hypothetical protein D3C85_1758670 [compost metagenome]
MLHRLIGGKVIIGHLGEFAEPACTGQLCCEVDCFAITFKDLVNVNGFQMWKH